MKPSFPHACHRAKQLSKDVHTYIRFLIIIASESPFNFMVEVIQLNSTSGSGAHSCFVAHFLFLEVTKELREGV